MSTPPPTRTILLAVLAAALLGMLYLWSTSVNQQVHVAYDHALQRLEAIDARIGRDVLRLRVGLLAHDDGLLEDLSALERLRQRLAEPPRYIFRRVTRQQLRAALAAYEQSALEKAALIGRFVSSNAALRESLDAFPDLAQRVVEQAPPRLARPAAQLLGAVLHYQVSRGESERDVAYAAWTKLDGLAGQSARADLDAPVELALASSLLHARVLLEETPDLESLVARIHDVPTDERIAELQQSYEAAYAWAHRRAEWGRMLLVAFGSIAVLATLWTLGALSRAKARLQEVNEELDGRVQERTAALCEARERLEEDAAQLRRLNEELEDSNRELDDFAYIASHDLKEPLRGINNYAAFLLEDYSDVVDEEGRKKLSTLVRLGERMDGLIDQLLHYSRVGRTELACGETDLQVLVEEVVDSLHISLEERGVEVRIPEPLPTIHCDPVRVAEVFRNLIGNALKYNDEDAPWIEIGWHASDGVSDAEKPTPVFTVRDNGIGIREKHLDSVFRLFRRLHGRDKFGGGTGAGLTIVKKIVERHGGRIWVESVHGEGTTFSFELGAHEGHGPGTPAARRAEGAEAFGLGGRSDD